MRALSACSGDVHFARVHVIVLVVDVVCLMLVLSARVVVHAVVTAFPLPVFCSRRYTLYRSHTETCITECFFFVLNSFH